MESFTFIIPACNAEKTLQRTVSSILRLNLDVEILIVENGSSDNTTAAAEEIAGANPGVTVLHSEKGVSRARNTGISRASGKWIVFADADDECLDGITETLPLLERFRPDIVAGGFRKDTDPIVHDYKNMLTPIEGETLEDAKAWMISAPTLRMQAWAKIYSKAFLDKYSLRFDETLSYSEDSEFVLRALEACERLVITDRLFYLYHSAASSATRGFVEGRIDAYLRGLAAAEKDLEHASEPVKQSFIDYVNAHLNIIGVHDIFGCDVDEPWNRKRRRLKELMQTDVIKGAADRMKPGGSLQQLPALLCKYHFYNGAGMIFYMRSKQNQKRYRAAEEAQRAE